MRLRTLRLHLLFSSPGFNRPSSSTVSRHIRFRLYSSVNRMKSGAPNSYSRGRGSGPVGNPQVQHDGKYYKGVQMSNRKTQASKNYKWVEKKDPSASSTNTCSKPTIFEGGKSSSSSQESVPLSASPKIRGFKERRRMIDLENNNLSENCLEEMDESALPTQFGKKLKFDWMRKLNLKQGNYRNPVFTKNMNIPESLAEGEAFHLCLPRNRFFGSRKAYPEKGKETQSIQEINQGVLRSGMVLLKHYLNLQEQVEIVKTCQELGKGPRGFYRPGYKDGAKLRLQMMCLGLNWHPETKYADPQAGQDCEVPGIPHGFSLLVQRALSDAHSLIKKDGEIINVDEVLPVMYPDICIVNFYTSSGRLGLHQDRDESRESIRKGLPVVSFSVGDSAEFLYSDVRDVDKAEKVVLESGDVLIFGGMSRMVFHSVSSIIQNSAPEALLKETNLRPGRLNLTFRKF